MLLSPIFDNNPVIIVVFVLINDDVIGKLDNNTVRDWSYIQFQTNFDLNHEPTDLNHAATASIFLILPFSSRYSI